ncbi:hypothetical protein ISP17_13535 [Dyella ginsengisoli]|uniref:Uncharacterized protein n=1 Tax=Dyella ginsengisoli TaxID=363848 RepID=A0ABW8JUZ6_9GAMM
MSAPKVDVRAVMGMAAQVLDMDCNPTLAGDMREAGAAVAKLIDAQRGCADALREAAKQARRRGDNGHAAMCNRHALAAVAALAGIGGAA